MFTSGCTFLLIIAGGLVTSTGSGLAVPDWPNTYGHFMFTFPLDQMVGGIFYEHGHRLIASFVGFLTIILALWLWKREERRWVRILGFLALVVVVVQGILGGMTVLFFLPTAISVSHATLAQTFFVVICAIALFTSPWWRSEQPTTIEDRSRVPLFTLSVLATVAVYIQLIVGALMRHTQSGLVVPDFPLAHGQIFPSLDAGAIVRYNDALLRSDIRIAADGPITSSQIVVHMIHRYWAIVVSVMIIWLSTRLFKLPPNLRGLTRFGWVLVVLLVVQITLGALTVLSLKAIDITTAHVATGALLLVTSAVVTLRIAKASNDRFQKRSISSLAREVTAS